MAVLKCKMCGGQLEIDGDFGICTSDYCGTEQTVPTCHRTSYDAVTADEDYKRAVQCADAIQREKYESEARVMLAIATKSEYFSAVWVKNEWSRFIKLMKKDRSRLIIPCYRDMDPYELPDEFAHFQAQDMSKIGFMTDVVRGIKKIIDKKYDEHEEIHTKTEYTGAGIERKISSMLQRGNMALEDKEWDKADMFFEEVLNQDAYCSEAYLGKFYAKYHANNVATFISQIKEICSKCETHTIEIKPKYEELLDDEIKKYYEEGIITRENIIECFDFVGSYESELVSRKEQKKKVLEDIRTDKLFVRAKQYADKQGVSQLNRLIDELSDMFDKLIEQAEKSDNQNIAELNEFMIEQALTANERLKKMYCNNQKIKEYIAIVASILISLFLPGIFFYLCNLFIE